MDYIRVTFAAVPFCKFVPEFGIELFLVQLGFLIWIAIDSEKYYPKKKV